MKYYRRIYEKYLGHKEYKTVKGHSFDATTISLVARILHLAARDPNSTDHIVRKVETEIENVCMEEGGNDFNLYALSNGLSEGLTDDSALSPNLALDIVRSSFEVLLTSDL